MKSRLLYILLSCAVVHMLCGGCQSQTHDYKVVNECYTYHYSCSHHVIDGEKSPMCNHTCATPVLGVPYQPSSYSSTNSCLFVSKKRESTTDEYVPVYMDCVSELLWPDYRMYCLPGSHACYGYYASDYRICCCTGFKCNEPYDVVFQNRSHPPSFRGLAEAVYQVSLVSGPPSPTNAPSHTIMSAMLVTIVVLLGLILFFLGLTQCHQVRERRRRRALNRQRNSSGPSDWQDEPRLRKKNHWWLRCVWAPGQSVAVTSPGEDISLGQSSQPGHGSDTAEGVTFVTSKRSLFKKMFCCWYLNDNDTRMSTTPLYTSMNSRPLSGPRITGTGLPSPDPHPLNSPVAHPDIMQLQELHRTYRMNSDSMGWWQIVQSVHPLNTGQWVPEEGVLSSFSAMQLHGRVGDVWRAEWMHRENSEESTTAPSREAIVKIVYDMKVGANELAVHESTRQCAHLLPLNSAHLVYLLEHEIMSNCYWFVLPLCPWGSLHDFMSGRSNLRDTGGSGEDGDGTTSRCFLWTQSLKVMQGVAAGLHYLHLDLGVHGKFPIVHRDVKSSNILLREDFTPLLSDFGFATQLPPRFSYGGVVSEVGTPRYMAPELIVHIRVENRAAFLAHDVYALGLVLWEVLSRCRQMPVVNGDSLVMLNDLGPYEAPYKAEQREVEAEKLEKSQSILPLARSHRNSDLVLIVVDRRDRPKARPQWLQHADCRAVWNCIQECWEHEYDARLSAGCVNDRLAALLDKYQPRLPPS